MMVQEQKKNVYISGTKKPSVGRERSGKRKDGKERKNNDGRRGRRGKSVKEEKSEQGGGLDGPFRLSGQQQQQQSVWPMNRAHQGTNPYQLWGCTVISNSPVRYLGTP